VKHHPAIDHHHQARLGATVLVVMALLGASAGVYAESKKRNSFSDGITAKGPAVPTDEHRAAFSALHGAPTAPTAPGETAFAEMIFELQPVKSGEVLRGKVTRVVDGDTVWFVREGASKPMKIRLEGIDAPEICQDFGPEARSFLSERVLNRDVEAKLRAVDDWGRHIGKVFDRGADIGQRMLRDGMAWSLRYKWDRGPYMPDERMAESLHRGLHARSNPEMPRDFRKRHGTCHTEGPAPTAPTAGRSGG
jgi:micrococcal nuclease